jgi:hypothetical protein
LGEPDLTKREPPGLLVLVLAMNSIMSEELTILRRLGGLSSAV